MTHQTLSNFPMPLVVEVMPSGKRFRVMEPFTFELCYRLDCPLLRISVAEGFVTDMASIPTTAFLTIGAGLIISGHYTGIDWLLLIGVVVVLLMACLRKLGRHNEAAVIHDALCQGKYTISNYRLLVPFTRAEADKIFLDGMRVLGVKPWKRHLMYWAVRVGGWGSWRKR